MNSELAIIKEILKEKETLSNEFGMYSKIYLNTTENIKSKYSKLDLNDKDVLTVAASGDHIFNLKLCGAKNITIFDINPLAIHRVQLKKTCVEYLSYDEFTSFFFKYESKGKFLNKNIYDKIKNNLPYETRIIFNYLFNKYENIFSVIYYNFVSSLFEMKRVNNYLEEDNYLLLKDLLKETEIKSIVTDVKYLPKKLEDKYDYIDLSNINDTIEDIYDKDALMEYKRLIHSLSKHLNKYGQIEVGYIYDYYSTRNKAIFSNKEERQKVFTTDEFHTLIIDSYRHVKEKDAVIIYQKNK